MIHKWLRGESDNGLFKRTLCGRTIQTIKKLTDENENVTCSRCIKKLDTGGTTITIRIYIEDYSWLHHNKKDQKIEDKMHELVMMAKEAESIRK